MYLDILIERLKLYSEEQICDLLGITSEDLIERFMDIIEYKQDSIGSELEVFEEQDENYIVDELDGFNILNEDGEDEENVET